MEEPDLRRMQNCICESKRRSEDLRKVKEKRMSDIKIPREEQMICVTVCSSRGFLFQKIIPVSISPVPDNPHQRYQQSWS